MACHIHLELETSPLDFEISLLRLLEKITNGTTIEISYTGRSMGRYFESLLIFCTAGTSVLLKPGIISGGPVTHECPLSRSIGYYLEPILLLAPFAKQPLSLTLRGITTNDEDLSVRHSINAKHILSNY
jgi:RNA 3'-terminal phosphate cyclase-like protein